MPAISHKDVPVYLSTGGGFTPILAQNVSIQYQNKLRPNRILNSSQSTQFDRYGIDGPMDASISLAFYAETSGSGAKYCLETLTGNTSGQISIAGAVFDTCYLNSATVNIQPFAPVIINTDFICHNPPIGGTWAKTIDGINRTITQIPNVSNYTQKIVYGHSVSLISGTGLSEATKDSISYSISCGRTPRYTIGNVNFGGSNTTRVFLDSLEKDISIKSTNITKYISYTGYDDAISIRLNDETGLNALSSNINFSAARILGQSLSASEGDALVAEIKAKEVVL
jgi:hypothetical protein